MTRPRLVSVDVVSRPPQMTLCFPGAPSRFITVRMRTEVRGAGLARVAAQTEIDAFAERDVELLRESAEPGPDLDVGDPALFEASVRPVFKVAASSLPVRCPLCSGTIAR